MKTYEEREYIKDLTNVMSLLHRTLDILNEAEPPTAHSDNHADLMSSVERSLSQCETVLKNIL